MTKWLHGEVTATCPTCGVDCAPWRRPVNLDWRDDTEREAGHQAVALMAHRYEAHRVEVHVGDLVRYWSPWRGLILGSEVYEVATIRENDHHEYARSMGPDVEPMLGLSYSLVNPARRDDRCFPFVGDPDRPITFELVAEAPPVELDLLDLLGWEPVDA
ncbi:hypothetical protein JNB62_05470 [Microbacterium jejuense]|uniref:DUF2199 domain-containing protein n=1 Tax=Microbacterium jejuense TaxID=1263637 RepID=A0ABS7HK69_9MICO|nr:hypothetical protein [Microbacterium jejuense]MBW9093125.1 hypothetical protein [Microbacterium jejuense]